MKRFAELKRRRGLRGILGCPSDTKDPDDWDWSNWENWPEEDKEAFPIEEEKELRKYRKVKECCDPFINRWHDTTELLPDYENVWFISEGKICVGMYEPEQQIFCMADGMGVELKNVRQWRFLEEKQFAKYPEEKQIVAAEVKGLPCLVTGIFTDHCIDEVTGDEFSALIFDEEYAFTGCGFSDATDWSNVWCWYSLPEEPMVIKEPVGDSVLAIMPEPEEVIEDNTGICTDCCEGEDCCEEIVPCEGPGCEEPAKVKSAILNAKGLSESKIRESKENDKVRDWYVKEYPTDDIGEEIRPEITFDDVYKCLENKQDVYKYLGVQDSIIRERVFDELADIKECDYDAIYDKWLETNDHESDEDEITDSTGDNWVWIYNTDDNIGEFVKKYGVPRGDDPDDERFNAGWRFSSPEDAKKMISDLTNGDIPYDEIELWINDELVELDDLDSLDNEGMEESKKSSGKRLQEDNYGWEIREDSVWEAFDYCKEVMGAEELAEALAKAMGEYQLKNTLEYICRNYEISGPFLVGYEEDYDESKKSVGKKMKENIVLDDEGNIDFEKSSITDEEKRAIIDYLRSSREEAELLPDVPHVVIESKKSLKEGISYEDALEKLNNGDWDNERFNDAISSGEVIVPTELNESKKVLKEGDHVKYMGKKYTIDSFLENNKVKISNESGEEVIVESSEIKDCTHSRMNEAIGDSIIYPEKNAEDFPEEGTSEVDSEDDEWEYADPIEDPRFVEDPIDDANYPLSRNTDYGKLDFSWLPDDLPDQVNGYLESIKK